MGLKSSIIGLVKGVLELTALIIQLIYCKISDTIRSLDKKLKIHMLIEQIANNNRGCITIHRSIVDLNELTQRITQMGGKLIDEFAYSLKNSDSHHSLRVTVCEFKGKIVELGLKNDNNLNVVWYRKGEETYQAISALKSLYRH